MRPPSIKELPAWEEPTRILLLEGESGEKNCRAEIPASKLTERALDILEELNAELSQVKFRIIN